MVKNWEEHRRPEDRSRKTRWFPLMTAQEAARKQARQAAQAPGGLRPGGQSQERERKAALCRTALTGHPGNCRGPLGVAWASTADHKGRNERNLKSGGGVGSFCLSGVTVITHLRLSNSYNRALKQLDFNVCEFFTFQ